MISLNVEFETLMNSCGSTTSSTNISEEIDVISSMAADYVHFSYETDSNSTELYEFSLKDEQSLTLKTDTIKEMTIDTKNSWISNGTNTSHSNNRSNDKTNQPKISY